MKKYVAMAAVVAATLSFSGAPSIAQDGATWLLVLTGTHGQVSGNTLTVTEDDSMVFGFTDRPNRNHTYMTTDGFAALWATGGDFSESPPNAVLTFLVDGEPVEVELVLDMAEAADSTVTFSFETVTGVVPGEFGAFSIFVDGVTVKICTGNCFF